MRTTGKKIKLSHRRKIRQLDRVPFERCKTAAEYMLRTLGKWEMAKGNAHKHTRKHRTKIAWQMKRTEKNRRNSTNVAHQQRREGDGGADFEIRTLW